MCRVELASVITHRAIGYMTCFRLSYNDTYPDVIRIRHQIDDLNKTISETRTAEKLREFNTRPEIVESSLENTSYNRLRGELSQTQVQLDTLTSRLNESRIQLNADLERGKQVHRTEAEIAELTRDYQVNRSIYEDLLKRRENARVSMNLDTENQGLNFKIQEPATLPLSASGLRFLDRKSVV